MKKFNPTKVAFRQNSVITMYRLALMVILSLLGPMSTKSRGDFELWGDEQLTINSRHTLGILHDTSSASIVSGGDVPNIYAYNSSKVHVFGGYVGFLDPRNLSTVNIYGGSVHRCYAWNFSSVNIFGGSLSSLDVADSVMANISGGSLTDLYANDSSIVTFYGKNFRGSGGITFDGERVIGKGVLSGEWMDGTRWSVNIEANYLTATIRVIPEPSTLLLLGLGALFLRRKR